MIQRDSLGYVLFGGTKPAAFSSIPIVCNYAIVPPSITESPLRYQTTLKQCWEVWERHSHKFTHPNIIVCKEHDCFGQSSFLQLFFIDKRRLIDLLETYREDFAGVLGKNFSSEAFIARLEQKEKLRPLLKYDEKLLGIILGFGRESASAFENFNLTEDISAPYERVGRSLPGCCITPVSFMGNPNSQEVNVLIDAYTQEMQHIAIIYANHGFLENALKAYCSP